VASVVVDLWNWVTAHAAQANTGKDKAFEQLTPSLRRFITATTEEMHDTVDAQFAWRLPVGFDVHAFQKQIEAWPKDLKTRLNFKFRGYEQAWRGDRTNSLARSFLAGLRSVDASEKLGFVLKTGTSDMNVVAPVWKCPVVAYGPGDSSLDHTPNEHLELDEYWKAVNVLEQTLRAYVEPGL
jgi:LysW-gamma-L-lysine carboxypeptidase